MDYWIRLYGIVKGIINRMPYYNHTTKKVWAQQYRAHINQNAR